MTLTLLLLVATQTPSPITGTAATPVLVDEKTAPAFSILEGKGAALMLLNPQNGARDAAVQVLTLEPGASVPEHVHASSAEILYVLDGVSMMTVGDKNVMLAKGSAVYIPAGLKHSAHVPAERLLPGVRGGLGTTASGGATKQSAPAEPFRALQVYVPPGPEDRFRKGPPLQR